MKAAEVLKREKRSGSIQKVTATGVDPHRERNPDFDDFIDNKVRYEAN